MNMDHNHCIHMDEYEVLATPLKKDTNWSKLIYWTCRFLKFLILRQFARIF